MTIGELKKLYEEAESLLDAYRNASTTYDYSLRQVILDILNEEYILKRTAILSAITILSHKLPFTRVDLDHLFYYKTWKDWEGYSDIYIEFASKIKELDDNWEFCDQEYLELGNENT